LSCHSIPRLIIEADNGMAGSVKIIKIISLVIVIVVLWEILRPFITISLVLLIFILPAVALMAALLYVLYRQLI
jgi:hypothetical protein